MELDGCTILFDSLPGGSQYGLNLGMTLVHETGEHHLMPASLCGKQQHLPAAFSRACWEAAPSYDSHPWRCIVCRALAGAAAHI